MSRIRTVKPELFRHLPLFEAEEKYRLPLRIAFVGLFTCCDRQGRFVWQPRRLKVDILPYDDVNIDDVLNALSESGFIKAYEKDGIVYGCIPTWESHQCPNNKEHDSKLPDILQARILKGPITQSMLTVHARLSEEAFLRMAQEPNVSVTRENHAQLTAAENLELLDDSAFPDEAPSLDFPDSAAESLSESTRVAREPLRDPHASITREALNGRERKGREKEKNTKGAARHAKSPSVASEAVLAVFHHWQQVMAYPQARLDASRQKWIREALRIGYSIAELCQAIDGCAQTPYYMGKNDRGQRYDGCHNIFKSADQIDQFIRHAHSPPQPQGKSDQRLQHNAQAAESWLNLSSVAGG